MADHYHKILQALNRAGVEYLVAGGFAVNFHAVNRATLDLDLIVHLTKKNTVLLDDTLKELGYVPKVPAEGKDLGDTKIRKTWIEEKNMIVFSYIDLNDPLVLVDIFVNEPAPFEDMYARRHEVKAFGVTIPVVGLADLIKMKKEANRPKDFWDITMLEKKHEQDA